MTGYEEGLRDGISAMAGHILDVCSVREILQHLEAIGEHFNRQPMDQGYEFKIVFEGLLRGHGTTGLGEVSEEMLDYRPVEHR